MADRIVEKGAGFWNVRGSFKLGGVVEIGTQTSLAQLSTGKFVLLDAYECDARAERQLMALTDQGRDIEAVLNLHPFHTVHVKRVAQQLPHARWYGTERHVRKAPDVRWEDARVDDEDAMHALFGDDFIFTVPRGVALIPDDEHLHFSSVLAYHKGSRTLHVDDTLTWVKAPIVGGLHFHPTLKSVLYPRAGAAAEFRGWAHDLITLCEDVDHLCTAHARPLPPEGARVVDHVREAFGRVQRTLAAHERRHDMG